jgi:hypothetical protein
MNERIKKLKEQATSYTWNGNDVTEELDEQKFAELIVEECRYIMDCNKGSDQHTEWNRALSETSNKIREHFGVEE